MATSFKNVLSKQVGTTPVIVYTAANNIKVTVLGISLANLTGSVVTASVYVTDPAPVGTFAATTTTTELVANVLTDVNTFNNISVGATLSGAGIPNNTYIVSFDTTAGTITMNNNATADATGVVIAFASIDEVEAYYIKDAIIPPNQSLRVINGGERLVLGASNRLKISTNTDASCDAIVSLVEIV